MHASLNVFDVPADFLVKYEYTHRVQSICKKTPHDMVLPSTGPLSASDIRTEYGLTGPFSLGTGGRAVDARIPGSGKSVSFANYRGLYFYPIATNTMYVEASNSQSYPGSGQTWFDISGNANNLFIPNVANVVYSSTSNLFNFRATGAATSNAMIGTTASSNVLQTVTSSSWLIEFVAKAGASNFVSTRPFLGCRDSNGSNVMVRLVVPNTAGSLVNTYRGNTNTRAEPTPGTLAHYAFRAVGGGGQLDIFKNGVSLGSSSVTEQSWLFGPGPFVIGNDNSNNANNWNGELYYLRMYCPAVGGAVLTQTYNALKDKYGIV